MKISEVSLGKEIKIGMPNYSNLTVRCDLKFELAEEEQPDWEQMWDEVNWQLQRQSDGLEPEWMLDKKQYKNFFLITIKQQKEAV
jgi:hypothetical protein